MQEISLGKTSYISTYELQKKLVEEVIQNQSEKIIICSHDPVVTLGKKTKPEDIQGWTGEVQQIERGGRATYHGPSQVIIYPIINLKHRGQNIAGFLECLESSMIEVLNNYRIQASGNPHRGNSDLTGVWVGEKKIASIGIAVKKWITYHGLALNLEHDSNAFQGISPCGYSADKMTSVEQILGQKVIRHDFEKKLMKNLKEKLLQLK